ncbi:diacylglycerol cholinephosphotransferase/ diacylglycerol ethanolaminesphotransferase Ept1 [Schizosaccharomyces osmophilus]|uniref:Diacylglycerol cholinephosphotransferase/ diacylglycerol ethanolaminesphotransferase Ept1 n=1 Tax=Schizosaccharomyces osmophilus TaxID=2545709 RepID=A0AAE9WAP0_9SCHI|nr:diacylglycerol cholinephosphotransferase/ diacylglycerol ethanolaminesphotransferase Ept1 [Schizosaccharomyces osmophilus]WBW72159.1 diacylglycerol cholinephosphotransferase/ diacylglycerol ethanolaminesphotransferase Ept1 [Schizosaccharomyces osmophilus]
MHLNRQQLKSLHNYQYVGVDNSLLSRHVLKPYWWNQLLKVIPMWMAPNLITLTGLGFVTVNVITMLVYKYGYGMEGYPGWVYASWAVGLFLYQSFDAIDGSQARRTNSSSPLGQLFDHGVDAINTSLEVWLTTELFQLSIPLAIITQCASLLYFYASTWEEYHTGVLYLSYFSGPVEGILMVCVLFGMTSYTGSVFWTKLHPTPESFGTLRSIIPYYTYGSCMFNLMGVGLFLNIYQSIRNTTRTLKEQKKCVCKGLFGLSPYLAQWAAVFLLYAKYPNFFEEQFIAIYLLNAILLAYSVGIVIVSHVTESSFPYWNVLILPFMVNALDAYTFGILEGHQKEYLFAYFGFGLGIYGNFVAHVISSITEEYGISCLRLRPKPDEKKN